MSKVVFVRGAAPSQLSAVESGVRALLQTLQPAGYDCPLALFIVQTAHTPAGELALLFPSPLVAKEVAARLGGWGGFSLPLPDGHTVLALTAFRKASPPASRLISPGAATVASNTASTASASRATSSRATSQSSTCPDTSRGNFGLSTLAAAVPVM